MTSRAATSHQVAPESSPAQHPSKTQLLAQSQVPIPKKVLLVEQQDCLRKTLGDLLRRRGLEVTEAPPEAVDIFSRSCPWDAVVFNASQRPFRRRRWLFGYRPSLGQTRLVALCDAPQCDPCDPVPRELSEASSFSSSSASTDFQVFSTHPAASPSLLSSPSSPSFGRHEVDATVTYPVSVSLLVNAILGDEPRARPRPPRAKALTRFREADTDPGLRSRAPGRKPSEP